jgi:hypothetical protein
MPLLILLVTAVLAAGSMASQNSQSQTKRKRVLALGDTRTGFTHDSISHALATIDRLGRESGLFETYIRTDSQWITKQEVPAPARNARNLGRSRRSEDVPGSAQMVYGNDERRCHTAAGAACDIVETMTDINYSCDRLF